MSKKLSELYGYKNVVAQPETLVHIVPANIFMSLYWWFFEATGRYTLKQAIKKLPYELRDSQLKKILKHTQKNRYTLVIDDEIEVYLSVKELPPQFQNIQTETFSVLNYFALYLRQPWCSILISHVLLSVALLISLFIFYGQRLQEAERAGVFSVSPDCDSTCLHSIIGSNSAALYLLTVILLSFVIIPVLYYLLKKLAKTTIKISQLRQEVLIFMITSITVLWTTLSDPSHIKLFSIMLETNKKYDFKISELIFIPKIKHTD